jgi:replication factor C subunit 3/5
MMEIDQSNAQISTSNTGAALLPFVEKYRPDDLTEIISHKEIVQTISKFISEKRLPHLLFHGPPGTGKTSCVQAIAKQLYGN